MKYRVTHLLANLGWVDLDLGCSNLCLVLPGLMGNWQIWLSIRARWWNLPNQSQPRFARRCVTPYTSDKDSHKTGIFGVLGSYLQEAKIDVRPSKNVFTEPIFRGGKQGNHSIMFELFPSEKSVQSGWSGCRTGNGKKLSSSQAQLGQATYLAVAQFIAVSCETSSLLTSVKQALPGGTCGPGGGSR